MRIWIVLNKWYDLDLIALHDVGYPLSTMMKRAITAYAHKEPLRFYIDQQIRYENKDKKGFRFELKINEKDTETIEFLSKVRKRYRNAMCKLILRNTMVQQNLPCYFDNDAIWQYHNADFINNSSAPMENVTYGSVIRKKDRTINVLGHVIDIDKVRGTKDVPSFIPTKENTEVSKKVKTEKKEKTKTVKKEVLIKDVLAKEDRTDLADVNTEKVAPAEDTNKGTTNIYDATNEFNPAFAADEEDVPVKDNESFQQEMMAMFDNL